MFVKHCWGCGSHVCLSFVPPTTLVVVKTLNPSVPLHSTGIPLCLDCPYAFTSFPLFSRPLEVGRQEVRKLPRMRHLLLRVVKLRLKVRLFG